MIIFYKDEVNKKGNVTWEDIDRLLQRRPSAPSPEPKPHPKPTPTSSSRPPFAMAPPGRQNRHFHL